jgi:hypothetical protein
VTRNLWHSCGKYRLADHFAGKLPGVRKVFDRFAAVAKACGPVTIYAQKTRIVFQTRVRFGGGVALKSYFRAGLWLRRRVSHPRLVRVESFGTLGYGHYFRLTAPKDVDAAFAKLVREAYATAGREPRRA